jgi:hypothetical protein
MERKPTVQFLSVPVAINKNKKTKWRNFSEVFLRVFGGHPAVRRRMFKTLPPDIQAFWSF